MGFTKEKKNGYFRVILELSCTLYCIVCMNECKGLEGYFQAILLFSLFPCINCISDLLKLFKMAAETIAGDEVLCRLDEQTLVDRLSLPRQSFFQLSDRLGASKFRHQPPRPLVCSVTINLTNAWSPVNAPQKFVAPQFTTGGRKTETQPRGLV